MKNIPIKENGKAPTPKKVEKKGFSKPTTLGSVNMVNVDSSNVKSMGYDAVNKKLIIIFSGKDEDDEKIFVYKDVPNIHFVTMMKTDSVGRYLSMNIKGQYEFEVSSREQLNKTRKEVPETKSGNSGPYG